MQIPNCISKSEKMSYLDTLKYWRNSLADATRPAIRLDEGKVSYVIEGIEAIDLSIGKVSADLAKKIIDGESIKLNDQNGIKDRKDPEWVQLDQISVLISPFIINSKVGHSKSIQDENLMLPFLIRANLDNTGALSIPDETMPYVCRDYLEPLPPQSLDYVFSSVDQVDQAFSDVFVGTDWEQYYRYIADQFYAMTDQHINSYTAIEYEKFERCVLIVDESIQMAADGIVKLYDHLIHLNIEELPLLTNLTRFDPTTLRPLIPYSEFVQRSTSHLGQMGYEYPLSITQRQSLYEINQMEDGEIIAVNGPPGTGKTTLLQSVVANEVVKSAINGGEPTVILACSTNNQAVTNIVDSFQHVKTKNELLYSRWIPDINSFALYLPSTGKEVSEQIPFQKLKAGITDRIENDDFLYKARQVFINNFHQQFPAQKFINGLTEIAEFLRAELVGRENELKQGGKHWIGFVEIQQLIGRLKYKEEIGFGRNDFLSQINNITNELKDGEKIKNEYFLREPWWIKVFIFLPFVAKIREQQLKALFRGFTFDLSAVDMKRAKDIDQFFESNFEVLQKIEDRIRQWNAWKGKNKIQTDPPFSENDYLAVGNNKKSFFFDELETGLRNEMFFLAVHYWEARWLVEMEQALDENSHWKTVDQFALKRWRRFSMLFPCFVSTFYMAPKFFQKLKYEGKDANGKNKWDSIPLYGGIDYLIVDEAGQVTPEVGAATFSLAKKSVVVGDILQIDPVWSVSKAVDKANLYKHTLLRNEGDYSALSDAGFLCSTGSIMKMAQKTAPHHEREKLSRGLWLTEHRRCYDEIIGYCNQLAYKGLLQAKKGAAPNDLVLPPMAFIHHDFDTDPSPVSKANREEASFIARWISEHSAQILSYYQQLEEAAAVKENRAVKQLIIGDLIAVITPFARQKAILKSVLQKANIPMKNLTIGTVHALQGAERPIILFSSVYGPNMKNTSFFFDMGPNMLNVAVSRAKDSFIMFGHDNLYRNNANRSPSSLLYKYMNKKDG